AHVQRMEFQLGQFAQTAAMTRRRCLGVRSSRASARGLPSRGAATYSRLAYDPARSDPFLFRPLDA
ncbi:MAG: hypothetical protein QM639_19685, partial [Rhodocyclaceae bacterium]